MKISLLYFIFLMTLLYNVSSEPINILSQAGNFIVLEWVKKIVFNSASRKRWKIAFEIKAQSFNKENIKYEFSDNSELSSYINNNPT